MKLGLLYDLRNPPRPDWFVPWGKYYDQALEHIAEMDRLGFDEVTFTEHHFDPDGYNPSMIAMMTATALKTKNVVIGQNILEMPLQHPVRLAEDLTTVDILSNGRVELDAGQAGWAFDSEFRALGINPKHRPSLLQENIEIVQKCWTEDTFSYHGKRWDLENISLTPKPVQQPHPPIFTTVRGEASMDRAAQMGLNACGQGGGGQTTLGVKPMWDEFRTRWKAALEKHGRNPADHQVNTFGLGYVTDDPEKAWAEHRESILYGINYRRKDGLQPYVGRMEKPPQVPEDIEDYQNVFRTPEDMIRHLRETFGESAPDTLIMMASRPGIPWEKSMEYMTNFATKVMPHVRDLPVKWD